MRCGRLESWTEPAPNGDTSCRKNETNPWNRQPSVSSLSSPLHSVRPFFDSRNSSGSDQLCVITLRTPLPHGFAVQPALLESVAYDCYKILHAGAGRQESSMIFNSPCLLPNHWRLYYLDWNCVKMCWILFTTLQHEQEIEMPTIEWTNKLADSLVFIKDSRSAPRTFRHSERSKDDFRWPLWPL